MSVAPSPDKLAPSPSKSQRDGVLDAKSTSSGIAGSAQSATEWDGKGLSALVRTGGGDEALAAALGLVLPSRPDAFLGTKPPPPALPQAVSPAPSAYLSVLAGAGGRAKPAGKLAPKRGGAAGPTPASAWPKRKDDNTAQAVEDGIVVALAALERR